MTPEQEQFFSALQTWISTQDDTAKWSTLIASLSGLLGAVIGALLSVGLPAYMDKRKRPKLTLSYTKESDLFDLNFIQNGEEKKRRYCTVQLGNVGKSTATKARVYLADLEKILQNGSREKISLGTSFQLAWPGWEFDARDVPQTLIWLSKSCR